MTLSDKQFKFVKDVNILLSFIINNGYKVTFGEAYRILYTQKYYLDQGLAKTMNSKHLDKLAIDLNIFKNIGDEYKYTVYKKDIQFIGDFWESLDKKNSWGGNWIKFTDTMHFERGY